MMSTSRRYELTDFEWSIIAPLLPNKPRGVARVDDRKVLTVSIGGCGRARPGPISPNAMVRRRPARTAFGAGRRSVSGIGSSRRWLCAYDGDLQMIDSSSIRVHQHGATSKGAPDATATARDQARAQCMGRSRGGLTTKIHALVDANGLPVVLKLTEGQAHDSVSAADMLETLTEGQSCSQTAPTTATACDRRCAHAAPSPTSGQWQGATNAPLQPVALPPAQPRRALLLQAQALPRHRHTIRKARRHLPRRSQTCCRSDMDALYELVS